MATNPKLITAADIHRLLGVSRQAAWKRTQTPLFRNIVPVAIKTSYGNLYESKDVRKYVKEFDRQKKLRTVKK